MDFLEYIGNNIDQIISLLIEHIELTFLSVLLAIVIGVPIGILISYVKKINKPVLGIASVIQAIPSMALLGFAIPFLGIGTTPAIVMVVLYSLLPIIKNTFTGISNIDSNMIESATGIGLTKWQILVKIQIPLALPVIMAGIRISAVTAVGLMTMAAFIGGGGLGYLVFSGIRTVNNYQILAGAIPACLLALAVDYIIGIVEKLVTPISLQKGSDIDKKLLKKKRFHQKIILIVTAIIIVIIFGYTYFSSNKNDNAIVVGSKDFTEQNILCYMVSDAIKDKTDYETVENCNLGGTQVCFEALKRGDIDLYIDYTGTVYGDTLNYEPITDIDKVYNTVKSDLNSKYNIEVLDQMGFNNTYTLAVKQETANLYNLKTMSDLSRVSSNLVISPSLEFINREDGLNRVSSVYSYNFKDIIGIDGSPRYTALMNNESDVVDAFATDGLLKKFNLVVLEDDKNAFPPYYAIPLVRSDTLEEYPEIEEVLSSLGSKLNNDIMSELNYRVDELGENPRDVAREYLDSIDF